MVENVRLRPEHDLQRFFQALEIRDEHFDAAIGNQLADLANGFGKDFCAAHVVIVAIHAGHDGMFQAQSGHRFSYAARFVPINRLRTAFGDSAEPAAAGADIAQQHERRGLVIPALADVGTLRRFANRVQPQPARQLFEFVKIVANGRFGPQPSRLGNTQRRADFDLNQL